ncbi:hypothetical protein JCM10213v2_003590 [Rhodosporidiobolus nylandii]
MHPLTGANSAARVKVNGGRMAGGSGDCSDGGIGKLDAGWYRNGKSASSAGWGQNPAHDKQPLSPGEVVYRGPLLNAIATACVSSDLPVPFSAPPLPTSFPSTRLSRQLAESTDLRAIREPPAATPKPTKTGTWLAPAPLRPQVSGPEAGWVAEQEAKKRCLEAIEAAGRKMREQERAAARERAIAQAHSRGVQGDEETSGMSRNVQGSGEQSKFGIRKVDGHPVGACAERVKQQQAGLYRASVALALALGDSTLTSAATPVSASAALPPPALLSPACSNPFGDSAGPPTLTKRARRRQAAFQREAARKQEDHDFETELAAHLDALERDGRALPPPAPESKDAELCKEGNPRVAKETSTSGMSAQNEATEEALEKEEPLEEKEQASTPVESVRQGTPPAAVNASASCPPAMPQDVVQLFIHASSTVVIVLPRDATVGELKDNITNIEGIPLAHMKVALHGRFLVDDTATLFESGVRNLATLEVSVRGCGGAKKTAQATPPSDEDKSEDDAEQDDPGLKAKKEKKTRRKKTKEEKASLAELWAKTPSREQKEALVTYEKDEKGAFVLQDGKKVVAMTYKAVESWFATQRRQAKSASQPDRGNGYKTHAQRAEAGLTSTFMAEVVSEALQQVMDNPSPAGAASTSTSSKKSKSQANEDQMAKILDELKPTFVQLAAKHLAKRANYTIPAASEPTPAPSTAFLDKMGVDPTKADQSRHVEISEYAGMKESDIPDYVVRVRPELVGGKTNVFTSSALAVDPTYKKFGTFIRSGPNNSGPMPGEIFAENVKHSNEMAIDVAYRSNNLGDILVQPYALDWSTREHSNLILRCTEGEVEETEVNAGFANASYNVKNQDSHSRISIESNSSKGLVKLHGKTNDHNDRTTRTLIQTSGSWNPSATSYGRQRDENGLTSKNMSEESGTLLLMPWDSVWTKQVGENYDRLHGSLEALGQYSSHKAPLEAPENPNFVHPRFKTDAKNLQKRRRAAKRDNSKAGKIGGRTTALRYTGTNLPKMLTPEGLKITFSTGNDALAFTIPKLPDDNKRRSLNYSAAAVKAGRTPLVKGKTSIDKAVAASILPDTPPTLRVSARTPSTCAADGDEDLAATGGDYSVCLNWGPNWSSTVTKGEAYQASTSPWTASAFKLLHDVGVWAVGKRTAEERGEVEEEEQEDEDEDESVENCEEKYEREDEAGTGGRKHRLNREDDFMQKRLKCDIDELLAHDKTFRKEMGTMLMSDEHTCGCVLDESLDLESFAGEHPQDVYDFFSGATTGEKAAAKSCLSRQADALSIALPDVWRTTDDGDVEVVRWVFGTNDECRRALITTPSLGTRIAEGLSFLPVSVAGEAGKRLLASVVHYPSTSKGGISETFAPSEGTRAIVGAEALRCIVGLVERGEEKGENEGSRLKGVVRKNGRDYRLKTVL